MNQHLHTPIQTLQRNLEEEAMQTMDPSDMTGMPHPVSAPINILRLQSLLALAAAPAQLDPAARLPGLGAVPGHAPGAPACALAAPRAG